MVDTTTKAHSTGRTPEKTAAAIIEILTEEFEQLYALSGALTPRLAPVEGAELPEINAWRLAQMIEEGLESCEILKLIEQTLAEIQ